MSTYDIFISHSSKDKEKAQFLAVDLKSQGYKVWFDTVEIEPSEDWIEEIEQGIDGSSVVVVIWTENAASSKWVKRELARADDKGKPVIPLRFDDTETSNILLQRVQYIDFQPGYHREFPGLVSRLMSLIDDSEQPATPSNLAWKPVPRPFYRSHFLEDNNYLDRKSTDFAVNERTKRLVYYNHKPVNKFMTMVAVPIPNPRYSDFVDELPALLQLDAHPRGLGKKDGGHPWLWFSLAELHSPHTSQADFVLFDERHLYQDPIEKLKWGKYLRFSEDGAIEYATAWDVNFTESGNLYAFNFIHILGTAWKFINMTAYVYTQLGYHENFQLLVNLRNTRDSTLGNFAWDKNKNHSSSWPSPISPGFAAMHFSERGEGISSDTHLQFIFNVNAQALSNTPSLSEDLIVALSKKLQLGFNFRIQPRHYSRNTTEFPWRQYRDR